MALDERYVVRTDLSEYFVDKDTGEPLANGTIEFYEDNNRISAKDVFELAGSPPNYSYTALPNPLSLSSVGTPINAANQQTPIYFYPYDDDGNPQNYYIVVKDSGGAEQFTLQGWPNIVDGSGPVDDTHGKVTNELINSQFVDVYFNPDATYTNSSLTGTTTLPIGPGWDLVVTASGTGTLSVMRTYESGSAGIPGAPSTDLKVNPAYSLKITPTANITQIQLRQRLNNDPGIWAGQRLSGYFIGRSTSGGGRMHLDYTPSGGTSGTQTIAELNPLTTTWTAAKTSIEVNASTNSQTSETGYVDIVLNLPADRETEVTAIQVVAMGTDTSAAEYDSQPAQYQRSLNIQAYRESMLILPKNSILTGWNFTLNPWQFTTSTPTNLTLAAATGAYTADQTIIMTEQANGVNIGKSTGVNNGALQISKGAGSAGKIALYQYVDIETARQVTGQYVSCLVRGLMSGNSNTVKIKMAILHRTDTPPDLDPFNAVQSDLLASGNLTSGWTAATPELDTEYALETSTLSPSGRQTYPYYSFDKILIPNTAKYICVVLWTSDGTIDDGALYLHDISCVPNEFALDATPQTFDQCLHECQYYYEKSYAQGVLPGTATNVNAVSAMQRDVVNITGLSINVFLSPFMLNFENRKRTAAPAITLYDLGGTANRLTLSAYYGDAVGVSGTPAGTTWTPSPATVTALQSQFTLVASGGDSGDDRAQYFENTTTAAINVTGLTSGGEGIYGVLQYHYTVSARLGIEP